MIMNAFPSLAAAYSLKEEYRLGDHTTIVNCPTVYLRVSMVKSVHIFPFQEKLATFKGLERELSLACLKPYVTP